MCRGQGLLVLIVNRRRYISTGVLCPHIVWLCAGSKVTVSGITRYLRDIYSIPKVVGEAQ